MRVATFNILNGRAPTDQRVDLPRLAAAVRRLDADVLALQEVDREQHRSGNADLTAVAAEAMGALEHRFVPALVGDPGGTWAAATGEEPPGCAGYGIALLSRLPVHSWRVVRLAPVALPVPMRFPGSGRLHLVRDEPRVALVAAIETPHGMVTFVTTHLSFIPWWNGRQLRHLLRSVMGHTGPLVLLGDLNMRPERVGRLTQLRPAASHLTFPAGVPTKQLDHILVRGPFVPSGSEAPALPISDHRPLLIRL